MNKADDSDNPASRKQYQSTKQSHPGTVLAKGDHEEKKAVQATEKSTNSEGEPSPMEPDRVLEWIKNRDNHNAIIAGFTALIFLATFAYAVIASFQWSAMRESNEINRQSLVTVQRAFLTADTVDIQRFKYPDGLRHHWVILAGYQNTGTTPATNVINYGNTGLGMQEPTEEAFKGQSAEFQVATVGPRTPQGVNLMDREETFLFGEELSDPLTYIPPIRDKKTLFLWGWIAYRDIFPDTAPHITEFCRELDSIMLADNGRLRFGLNNCLKHNCVDDKCPDYKDIVDIMLKQKL